MFDAVADRLTAEAPSVPLSARAVLGHLAPTIALLAFLVAAVAGWQYAAAGAGRAVFVAGSGAAVLIALAAGVFGALDRRVFAAVCIAGAIALLGQVGPLAADLGMARTAVRFAALGVLLAIAAAGIVGYAEVGRLRAGGA